MHQQRGYYQVSCVMRSEWRPVESHASHCRIVFESVFSAAPANWTQITTTSERYPSHLFIIDRLICFRYGIWNYFRLPVFLLFFPWGCQNFREKSPTGYWTDSSRLTLNWKADPNPFLLGKSYYWTTKKGEPKNYRRSRPLASGTSISSCLKSLSKYRLRQSKTCLSRRTIRISRFPIYYMYFRWSSCFGLVVIRTITVRPNSTHHISAPSCRFFFV